MRGPHFSLRWLFGFVSFLAIGCGVLIYATPFLSRLMLTTVLVILWASVLAAACHTGERRIFWAGFAFFGIAYGWIVCGSWQSPAGDGPLQHRLATTSILEWCHQRAPHTRKFSTTASPPPGMMMGGMGGPMGGGPMMGGMPGTGMGPPVMPGGAPGVLVVTQSPDWSDFATTGHSLFTLAFAMLGGVIAARCYARAKAGGLS
ncbi:MAG TPA: hypothetical protein VG826_24095 [Pirellulales bacterium]|nr:hypothetical protein [Pirellulales bacterium]